MSSIESSPRCVPATSSSSSTTHSDDGTAVIARGRGARVVTTSPAPGWLGKPHACWRGAAATAGPTLLFIDADVLPSTHLLDDIDAVARAHPDVVVSVQPWHRTERWYEQASLLCNVAALMGSGAFTVLGERVHPTVAFGPVLAMRRVRYEGVGGHEAVRDRHTEDIGLARLAGGAVLFTGRPDTTFRMYPDGWRQLLDGWTRTIVAGFRSTRWWVALGVVWWIAALAGGWLAGGLPVHDPLRAGLVYLLVRCAVLGARTTCGIDPPADRGAVPLGSRRVRPDRRPRLRRRGPPPGCHLEGAPRGCPFGLRRFRRRSGQTSIRILPTLAFDSIRR